ncbi:hypothetical protein EZS27_008885 [termite gut metagenome]|uniref:BACON domain-containing protein n=1 Tax=termite gut metagenome TaxID=433724 RepID=A0A5J4SDD3_9ZZZZ
MEKTNFKTMKKLFFVILAGFIGLVSCQEDREIGNSSGEVNFKVAVGLPGAATRADGQLGSINTDKYLIRYILEIYGTPEAAPVKRYVRYEEVSTTPGTSFSIHLLKGTYTFAVWADFVLKGELGASGVLPEDVSDEDSPKDYAYKTTEGLGKVSIIDYSTAADLADGERLVRGAYCGTTNETISENSILSINLERPFGRVELFADDWSEFKTEQGGAIDQTKISVTYSSIPSEYDVLGGEITGTPLTDATFKVDLSKISSSDAALNLFYDYIFAIPATTPTYPIKIEVLKGITALVSHELSIPVVQNKVTLLKGKVFAGIEEEVPLTVTVGIEDGLTEPSEGYIKLEGGSFSEKTVNVAFSANNLSYTLVTDIPGWSVSSDQEEWCAVVLNEKNLTVTVLENETGAPRTATLTFKSSFLEEKVVVTQRAKPVLTLSSEELTFDGEGMIQGEEGANTVTVTKNFTEDWEYTVTPENEWLYVADNHADNTLTITARVNLQATSRDATIEIQAKNEVDGITPSATITVTQTGGAPSVTATPDAVVFNRDGTIKSTSSATVAITSNLEEDWTWTATPDDGAWLDLTPNLEDNTLTIAAKGSNTTNADYSTTVTIQVGEGGPTTTLTVTQDRTPVVEVEANVTVGGDPQDGQTFTISTNVPLTASIEGNPNWITIPTTEIPEGQDQQITFNILESNDPVTLKFSNMPTVSKPALPNTSDDAVSSPRIATITFTATGVEPAFTKTMTVKQNGWLYSGTQLAFSGNQFYTPRVNANTGSQPVIDFNAPDKGWDALHEYLGRFLHVSPTSDSNLAFQFPHAATTVTLLRMTRPYEYWFEFDLGEGQETTFFKYEIGVANAAPWGLEYYVWAGEESVAPEDGGTYRWLPNNTASMSDDEKARYNLWKNDTDKWIKLTQSLSESDLVPFSYKKILTSPIHASAVPFRVIRFVIPDSENGSQLADFKFWKLTRTENTAE